MLFPPLFTKEHHYTIQTMDETMPFTVPKNVQGITTQENNKRKEQLTIFK